MNYLAMTYRIVMSGAISPRTIDGSLRVIQRGQRISIRGIYVSVVLTKSRANSPGLSSVRAWIFIDFPMGRRWVRFRGRRGSEIAVRARCARVGAPVYRRYSRWRKN